ncbi:MAG TPA: Uma2 family endonuclease [Pyrinomonadaceae bacterium]|nr:Uma2 family endonuclease [Pyrinomonadaceae bacterium]
MSVNFDKHHFTVSEYERMGETGVFSPDARFELIEGEIIEMSPIGSRHAACVELVAELIREWVQSRFLVRTQNPIVLDDFSEPQPDIAVLRFRPDRYRTAHPRPDDVLLIIEVAETTVSYDRNVKVPLYARAGIAESLLFNLPDGRLEYFSRPDRGVYQANRFINRGERFESASVPGLTLDVDIILG